MEEFISTGGIIHDGVAPQNMNYFQEDRNLVVQAFPPTPGECSRNPSISVYQLALM